MIIFALAIGALTASIGPVFCAGTAIVLNGLPSEDEIGPRPGSELAMQWPGLAQVLSKYDVNIVTPDVSSLEGIGGALSTLSSDITPESPLVVVARAVLIEDKPAGWLFFGPGSEIFDNELADRALNAGVLAEIARQHQGPVVLIVATDAKDVNIGGLFAADTADLPEQLTYAVISPAFVPEFLDKAVLKPGVPLASLKTALPLDGQIAGALPEDTSLSGVVLPEVVSELAYDKGIWSALAAINKPNSVGQYMTLQPDGAHITEAQVRLYRLQYNSAAVAAEEEAGLKLTDDQKFQIEDSLDYLGYFIDVIDGDWGDDTREAIRNWQLWSKFPVTGYLNAAQLAALHEDVLKQEEQDRQFALDEERAEREYWLATGQRGSEQELRAYLARYPSGIFSNIAYERLDKLADAISAQTGGKRQPVVRPAREEAPKAPAAAEKAAKPEPQNAPKKAAESKTPGSKRPAAALREQPVANASSGDTGKSDQTFLQRIFDQNGDEITQETDIPAATQSVNTKAATRSVSEPPKVKVPSVAPSAVPSADATPPKTSKVRKIGNRIRGLFTGKKEAEAQPAPKVRSRAASGVVKDSDFKVLNPPEVEPLNRADAKPAYKR